MAARQPAMSPSVHEKVYNPLGHNEIRILTLLPGPRFAQVRCTLSHRKLLPSATCSYEALSYTWGTSEDSDTIWLNGHRFTIRANLLQILKNLRYMFCTRSLWIDALCINQSDVDERSSQVAIMCNLYRKALAVLAWIGEDEKGVTGLFNFLTETEGKFYSPDESDRRSNLLGTWIQVFSAGRADFEPIPRLGVTFPCEEFKLKFRYIIEKTYWSRVWIIQEILSGSNVQLICGGSSLSLDYLASSIRSCAALESGFYTEIGLSAACISQRIIEVSSERKDGR